jgi:hypothetical protein
LISLFPPELNVAEDAAKPSGEREQKRERTPVTPIARTAPVIKEPAPAPRPVTSEPVAAQPAQSPEPVALQAAKPPPLAEVEEPKSAPHVAITAPTDVTAKEAAKTLDRPVEPVASSAPVAVSKARRVFIGDADRRTLDSLLSPSSIQGASRERR